MAEPERHLSGTSDVLALLSDNDDGFWIDIVCVNFIRSRRRAGAKGSRIHAVLGDSFCGVGVRGGVHRRNYI